MDKRLEVYDTVSDLVIADFDNNKMLISPQTARKEVFETFPTFSTDGLFNKQKRVNNYHTVPSDITYICFL